MRVFVLNSGRCGSLTFARSCEFMTNYTCAHESRIALVGEERLAYPDRHIEVDNRLSWFLGGLDRRYGHDAFYVHLTRDRSAVAESFVRRWEYGIIGAFAHRIVMRTGWPPEDRHAVARFYVDVVNENINQFLRDKPMKMHLDIESLGHSLPRFWEAIGAEGDLDAAIATAQRTYHSSSSPAEARAPISRWSAWRRIPRRIRRSARRFRPRS